MAPYGPEKPDSRRLRGQVRARIAAGELPRAVSARLFAGYGADQTCVVCGQSISPTQITYEVELILGADRRTLDFHLACHAAWQLEAQVVR